MSEILELFRELIRLEGQRDSLEIGTPGKRGAVKLYVDFGDVDGTKERIRKAIDARGFANDLLATEEAQDPVLRKKLEESVAVAKAGGPA